MVDMGRGREYRSYFKVVSQFILSLCTFKTSINSLISYYNPYYHTLINTMIFFILLFINFLVDNGIYFTILSFYLNLYVPVSMLLSLLHFIFQSGFLNFVKNKSIFFKELFKMFKTFIND